jgi:hypothetical protein
MKKSIKKTVQAKTDQPAKRDRAAPPLRTNQPKGDRWLLDDIDDAVLRQAWLDVAQQQEKGKKS